MSNYKRRMHIGNSVYYNTDRILLLLQFQHTVHLSTEDLNAIKNKQEYTLLAILSHKGDTPNSGTFCNDLLIRNLHM